MLSKKDLMFILELFTWTIFATMVLSTHGGPIRRTRTTDQMEHRYKNPCGGQRQATIDVTLLRGDSTEREVTKNFISEIEPLLEVLKQKFADLERKYVSKSTMSAFFIIHISKVSFHDWSCHSVYRRQDLCVAKTVLWILTSCTYWWENRYPYHPLMHDGTPPHS